MPDTALLAWFMFDEFSSEYICILLVSMVSLLFKANIEVRVFVEIPNSLTQKPNSEVVSPKRFEGTFVINLLLEKDHFFLLDFKKNTWNFGQYFCHKGNSTWESFEKMFPFPLPSCVLTGYSTACVAISSEYKIERKRGNSCFLITLIMGVLFEMHKNLFISEYDTILATKIHRILNQPENPRTVDSLTTRLTFTSL